MKPIRLLVVGQLRTTWFRDAAAHYFTALRRHQAAEEVVVRDAKTAQIDRRKAEEGHSLLDKITPRDRLIVLDEGGRSRTSRDLAAWLGDMLADPGRRPCFVVGGAFGLSPEVLKRADATLALGPGTLPHELARVVLYEQLYRAATILAGTPYHH